MHRLFAPRRHGGQLEGARTGWTLTSMMDNELARCGHTLLPVMRVYYGVIDKILISVIV